MNIFFKNLYITLSILLIFILSIDTFFILDQRKYAIVFQFGEAMRIEKNPGLKMKIPFINNVEFLEKRISNIESVSKELTTADSKRIIIDSFAKFKISDPLTYYKKMSNKSNGERLLESSLRQVIGKIQLTDLFSTNRFGAMQEIKEVMNNEAKAFGIDIIDVRIVHADFPEENSISIHKRMETERIKESMQIRAEGSEKATEITSLTDKEIEVILAEARHKGEIIRSKCDKLISKMYGEAYAKDLEFYKLYRNLETFKNIKSSKIIISPDSQFFQDLDFGKAK